VFDHVELLDHPRVVVAVVALGVAPRAGGDVLLP